MGALSRTGLAAMLAVAVFCVCAIGAARAAPLEAYGHLPSLENVVISPDGTKLAFIHTQENDRVVAVTSLADGKLLRGAKLGELKLRHVAWADDSHLLIWSSETGLPAGLIGSEHEFSLLLVFDLDTGKLRNYPELIRGTRMLNVVSGRVMVRHLADRTILFIPGVYFEGATKQALFKVDLKTGEQTIARLGMEGTRSWLVDDTGDVVTENDYNENSQTWGIRIRRDGRLATAISGHESIDIPQTVGFGPTGDSVLIEQWVGGNSMWKLLSLKDGSLAPPLNSGKELNEPIEDPATQRMIGGAHVDDDSTYYFFDEAVQKRWKSITDFFPGERVRLASFSKDMMRMVVRVDGAIHGFRYELIDLNTSTALPLGDVYNEVKQVFETRRIDYVAADGMHIPAYLTLPAGRPPSKLPLVVLPHGGPAVRDTADFDWWAQALASQGYAVLQPNYRGSDLKWNFVVAGFGEWGRKMQTDLSDGVRHLAQEGTIDPTRVCIVGASYGGYAALAGVTLDPGVYRCAVSVAGISDIRLWLQRDRVEHAHGSQLPQRWWDRFLGVTGSDDPVVDAISPIKHIDAVNVPVLLIHGRDDTIVPFDQSEVMLKALKRASKNVELVALKKEDHWLSRSETRLQMLQSSVAFLRANNPPD